jgi:predicted RNase H-like nuclease
MNVEWVVYACPTCGIQHNPHEMCFGMLTNPHAPIEVARVALRADEIDALREENEDLRDKIEELKAELESERIHGMELSEGWE